MVFSSTLSACTEWFSRHGGLPSFNRGLCSALVAEGCSVVCYVPRADVAEVEDARACGVRLEAICATLANPAAASEQAREIRRSLAPHLNWPTQIARLKDALSTLPGARARAPPTRR